MTKFLAIVVLIGQGGDAPTSGSFGFVPLRQAGGSQSLTTVGLFDAMSTAAPAWKGTLTVGKDKVGVRELRLTRSTNCSICRIPAIELSFAFEQPFAFPWPRRTRAESVATIELAAKAHDAMHEVFPVEELIVESCSRSKLEDGSVLYDVTFGKFFPARKPEAMWREFRLVVTITDNSAKGTVFEMGTAVGAFSLSRTEPARPMNE